MKGIKDTIIVQTMIGQRLRAARGKMKRPVFIQLLKENPKAPIESKAEMTTERLKQWEYGNNPINLEWIPAICEVLDCDVGYLFGEYEEQHHVSADIAAETGLTESAIQKLHNMRCENQITWFSDILNDLIEHEKFFLLLHYALGYVTAGDAVSETTKTGHRLSISYKDTYRMKISDSFEKILSSIAPKFENRKDYRWMYSLYRSMKDNPDKHGIVHSLDEIRQEMEADGLTFEPQLFEGEHK